MGNTKSYNAKLYRTKPWGLPKLGSGAISLWHRNCCYLKYAWAETTMWVLIEPLLYLGAIGYGVGSYISNVEGLSYIDFFFPAMLANTAMTISFLEATYGSFTKLTKQKTFSTILLAPVDVGEIVWGEILWAMTKAMMSVLGVVIIAAFFGLLKSVMILPAVIFLILISLTSASAGLLVTATSRDYTSFNYFISGVVVPMSLFSGTYFPIERFPVAFQWIAKCLPLTYGVEAIRGMLYEGWSHQYFLNAIIILFFAVVFLFFAFQKMYKKLIL